jgi:hypothetical protein
MTLKYLGLYKRDIKQKGESPSLEILLVEPERCNSGDDPRSRGQPPGDG